MNFFKHQDNARKKTTVLVVLLLLAVASLILVTVFGVAVLFYFFQTHSTSVTAAQAYHTGFGQHLLYIAQSEISGWIALGVVLVVIAGTGYKYLQLLGGGGQIAESLGGRLLQPDSQEPGERKILNIVEEMAIASGNNVPPVYLLPEPSINAFAAGLERQEAVIGITQGCLDSLSRDELQGVIAHEFSHIHNGDMRLNMRLIALLHGILVIGLIGYFLMRGAGGRHHRQSKSQKGQSAQFGLGLILVGVGYGGVFFGNIIKAAVSRQREYLADASAVQFTRNPEGIGNALKKIGGYPVGSDLGNKNAATYSHMYFSRGIRSSFSVLTATHPPLQQRIKRILPNWSGVYIRPGTTKGDSGATPETAATSRVHASKFSSAAIASVGQPNAENLAHAVRTIAKIPEHIVAAARQPYSARALVYALLLDKKPSLRKLQMNALEDQAHPATFKLVKQLYPDVLQLPRAKQLPVIELSMPALKQLSPTQYRVFKKNLVSLIRSDKQVSLFEWSLYRLLVQGLEPHSPRARRDTAALAHEISVLFSLVVVSGNNLYPDKAFQKGVTAIAMGNAHIKFTDQFSFKDVDTALSSLAEMKLLQKPKLLKAIAAIITADGEITPAEVELFRAVAATLDCPVPPLKV